MPTGSRVVETLACKRKGKMKLFTVNLFLISLSTISPISVVRRTRNILNKSLEETHPTSCPDCGGERRWVEVKPGMYLTNPQSKKIFPSSSIVVDAIVCLNCGYTTFYARDLFKLEE